MGQRTRLLPTNAEELVFNVGNDVMAWCSNLKKRYLVNFAYPNFVSDLENFPTLKRDRAIISPTLESVEHECRTCNNFMLSIIPGAEREST